MLLRKACHQGVHDPRLLLTGWLGNQMSTSASDFTLEVSHPRLCLIAVVIVNVAQYLSLRRRSAEVAVDAACCSVSLADCPSWCCPAVQLSPLSSESRARETVEREVNGVVGQHQRPDYHPYEGIHRHLEEKRKTSRYRKLQWEPACLCSCVQNKVFKTNGLTLHHVMR